MGRRAVARTPSLFDLGEEERPVQPARHRHFVQVALDRPPMREFTYAVPERLVPRATEGARVAVPFGPRRAVGVIVGVERTSALPPERVRAVLDVLDEQPVVGPELLGLARWIGERYACSWGEALAAALPPPLKREHQRRKVARVRARENVGRAELAALEERFPEQHRLLRTLLEIGAPITLRDVLRRLKLSDSPAKTLARRGWVLLEYVEEPPDPLASSITPRPRPARLSNAQERALLVLRGRLDARLPGTFLLHGVTGSGKTEVYLRAIEHALFLGRSAIVLVPEIALTPQTVGWFRSRFGAVCVLHSRLSDAQRLDEWRRLQRNEVKVVVGTRSAIFAPLAQLGVIVVDEEHEPSFKQESVPRYHARDVALERARRAGAVLVLGSATPSLETWHAARTGTIETLRLPERVGGGSLPAVHVVDMRLIGEHRGPSMLFSPLLVTLLQETLEHREQAILFLNRRGYVPILWCPGCKTTTRCERCSVALTYHRRIGRLVCHACCHEIAVPRACPTCTRPGLRPLGSGSERVEAELARLVPGARVRRMDSDTMHRREDYEESLTAFERHELDVLVGTQMIAKGLDFPRVTLVGIVAADQTLHVPDFRSGERTFQLIAQVAGRAGRAKLSGRIVVQTLMPDQPPVRLGARGDYEGFALQESDERSSHLYPPHGRVLRVLVEDKDEARVKDTAARIACELKKSIGEGRAEVTAANPCPHALVRGKHRHHLLLKALVGDPAFERGVRRAIELAAGFTRPAVKLDVDPMSFL